MSTFGSGSFGSGTFGNPGTSSTTIRLAGRTSAVVDPAGRLRLAIALRGRTVADVQVRGTLHVRIPLASSTSADVRAAGAIRFSKYLHGGVTADLGVFGLIRLTPNPLRGRINALVDPRGRLAVRIALGGRVSEHVRLRGDLRVPSFPRLLGRPVRVSLGAVGALRVSAPPPNDLFANAAAITGDAGTVAGANVNATTETGEPTGAFSTVWWRWVAPYSGEATFEVVDATFPFVSAIYAGDSVGALTFVGFEGLPFPIRRGAAYYLRVGGALSTSQGTVTFAWSSIATELASWSRDKSQRFRVDVDLIGLLRLDIPPTPAPARLGGEAGVRAHRTWVVMPDPVIGPNGFPV